MSAHNGIFGASKIAHSFSLKLLTVRMTGLILKGLIIFYPCRLEYPATDKLMFAGSVYRCAASSLGALAICVHKET